MLTQEQALTAAQKLANDIEGVAFEMVTRRPIILLNAAVTSQMWPDGVPKQDRFMTVHRAPVTVSEGTVLSGVVFTGAATGKPMMCFYDAGHAQWVSVTSQSLG